MQELALFISSVAGACTAVAIKKFPKSKKVPTVGVNAHIKNQINMLRIEKEILTKTISRLYQDDSGLSAIQRDKLLTRYQNQLGIILSKIENLEESSRHPDLGSLGDGLLTLMDQKLTQFDKKLHEISTKIEETSQKISRPKEEPVSQKEESKQEKKIEHKLIEERKTIPEPIPLEIPIPKPRRPIEITTLTEVSDRKIDFPLVEQKQISQPNNIVEAIVKSQGKVQDKIAILESSSFVSIPEVKIEPSKQEQVISQITKPDVEPTVERNIPEEPKVTTSDDDIDDDEGDLDKIKGEIMKTLSKLEQAEVE